MTCIHILLVKYSTWSNFDPKYAKQNKYFQDHRHSSPLPFQNHHPSSPIPIQNQCRSSPVLIQNQRRSSPLPFKNHRRRVKVLWRSRSMKEYNKYVRIADGDPVKLARMLEIQSWFDNLEQLAATVRVMAKYLE